MEGCPGPPAADARVSPRGSYICRFVPERACHLDDNIADAPDVPGPPTPANYSALLTANLNLLASPTREGPSYAQSHLSPRGVFRFTQPRPEAGGHSPPFPPLSPVADCPVRVRTERRVSRTPYKILDAPKLPDDFYMNLVDWSASNMLAVGLGSTVFLWNAQNSSVESLAALEDARPVCSVAWTQRGAYLAVGTNKGVVRIYDAAAKTLVRELCLHRGRVGALAWGGHTLATGGQDRRILLTDLRAPAPAARLAGHKAEVCGLKWSPDDRQLASGGNDNVVAVWAAGGGGAGSGGAEAVFRGTAHTAAVKALAWSPHQRGLLATGGGTSDKHIRVWNTLTGTAVSAVDAQSQVCALAWSRNANELVACYGYSTNAIELWRYPALTPVATLAGHTSRVLFLATSPDGQSIVTGAGDETLRFWNVFPKAQTAATLTSLSDGSQRSRIR